MAAMRAVQVTSPNGPFQMVERALPEPRPREVRIKVQACGLCHSDSLTKTGQHRECDRGSRTLEQIYIECRTRRSIEAIIMHVADDADNGEEARVAVPRGCSSFTYRTATPNRDPSPQNAWISSAW